MWEYRWEVKGGHTRWPLVDAVDCAHLTGGAKGAPEELHQLAQTFSLDQRRL